MIRVKHMELCILKKSETVRFCIISIQQSGYCIPRAEFDALSGLTSRDDWAIAALCVPDAENALSPWDGPAVFGDSDFGHGAEETLTNILDQVIPVLNTELGYPVYILEGYSFAGLFAIWAGYITGRFAAVCGVSPSVWFEGWLEYADKNTQRAGCAYLSVGASEKKTRNQRLARVEECIKAQHELHVRDIGADNCIFQLNQGNHFADVPMRRAKAMAWCLKTLCKNR